MISSILNNDADSAKHLAARMIRVLPYFTLLYLLEVIAFSFFVSSYFGTLPAVLFSLPLFAAVSFLSVSLYFCGEVSFRMIFIFMNFHAAAMLPFSIIQIINGVGPLIPSLRIAVCVFEIIFLIVLLPSKSSGFSLLQKKDQ